MSEASVSLEDQTRINNFSSKSVAQAFLEDRFKTLQKSVEANQDALEELDLVLDDEELIPCRYGDIFIMSSVEAVKERCQAEIESKTAQVHDLAGEIEEGKKELANLKTQLYSKFGDAIRLDYD